MKSFLMHRSPVWIRVRRMREKKIRILCTMLSLTGRMMEKEDYSTAEERWFLFSDTASLYDPAFMEILLKENLK